jgi:hypothetical protein
MAEEMMVAHAAFAGELRAKLAFEPHLKESIRLPRDERITERLLSACADLAHANVLVAHAASDVLDAYFELSQTRRVSPETFTQDEHTETVVDALMDVARGADVSNVGKSAGSVTTKRARVENARSASALECRRFCGAARAADTLRLALKRETRIEQRRNTSTGARERPCRGNQTDAKTSNTFARDETFDPRGVSVVFDGVARRADAVAFAAADAPAGPSASDADAAFLFKASALRLVVHANDAERWRRSERSRSARADAASNAALELMIQAFSSSSSAAADEENECVSRAPPAYYAHAAFVACERLYARRGKRAPTAFVAAAIKAGALDWPSASARTDTTDGPFPVTFADVAAPDGSVSVSVARAALASNLPRHERKRNTAATYIRAWLMAFHAGRGSLLEAAARGKRGDENDSLVAWPSPRAGDGDDAEATPARRLVRVFLGDDDALWDFMDCVLKAAVREEEEEEEEEDGRDDENELFQRRLGWRRGTGEGLTPSEVFLALLESLAWDVDAFESTLREEPFSATALGYIGRARQFAHEWTARDAEKLLRFCEAFASKLDARVREKRRRGFGKNSLAEISRDAREAFSFRAAELSEETLSALAMDPLRAAIAAARERLEG